MKILLLQVYFPRFYDLLLDEKIADPFADLLELARVRSAVRAGDPEAPVLITNLCHRLKLAPPAEAEPVEEAVVRLRQAVAPAVDELAGDADFVTLAWRFGETDQRQDLLDRVRTRAPSVDLLAPAMMSATCSFCGGPCSADSQVCPTCTMPVRGWLGPTMPMFPVPRSGRLRGRTFVWYDRSGRTRPTAAVLTAEGAQVKLVDTPRALRQALGLHGVTTAVIHVLGELEQPGDGVFEQTCAVVADSAGPLEPLVHVPVIAWGALLDTDGAARLEAAGAVYAGADHLDLIVLLAALPTPSIPSFPY